MRKIRFSKMGGVVNNYNDILFDLRTMLGLLGNGNYYLCIEKVKERRSLNQNDLMWLWFTHIAKEWSDAAGKVFTPQQVHDAYCVKYLPIDTPSGVVGGNTHTLTKDEMTEFLNNVQSDAASEYGIQLPNKSDSTFDAFRDFYSK